mgnify:CR=1 FL=1
MLKYVDTKVVFQEVPDEVTLAINMSNCPCHCEGCHSSYLAEDIGTPLNWNALLYDLIPNNKGITCICFMGGDAEPMEIMRLARWIRSRWPEIRTAWYSGKESIPEDFDITCLDYIKLGPYIEALGGLKSPDTNQALYRIASDATLTRIYIK